MRQKTEKTVVTFYTTAAAISAEKACGEADLPGRLIPVPRQLSAGCGFAWCSDPQQQPRLEELFQEKKIAYEEMVKMMV